MRVETIGRLRERIDTAEVAAINIIVVESGVRTAQLPWARFPFICIFSTRYLLLPIVARID